MNHNESSPQEDASSPQREAEAVGSAPGTPGGQFDMSPPHVCEVVPVGAPMNAVCKNGPTKPPKPQLCLQSMVGGTPSATTNSAPANQGNTKSLLIL